MRKRACIPICRCWGGFQVPFVYFGIVLTHILIYMNIQQDENDVSNPFVLEANEKSKKIQSDSMLEKRFALRREQVEKVCKIYRSNYTEEWDLVKLQGFAFPSFIASPKKLAIMCIVLKAGSSSWHNLFWQFRDAVSAKTLRFYERAVFGNFKAFKYMTTRRRVNLWLHPRTIKLVNVRHPFARLISGWNDKFTKRFFYKMWLKQFPLLNTYKATNKTWNGRGHFMKWKNFARYVADLGKDPKNLDQHFQPATHTCDPCRFPFDYIVKAETFSSSEEWLLEKKLNFTGEKITRRNTSKRSISDPALKIREYFSQLSHDTVKKLCEVYKYEMEVFGYTFDVDTLTAGGWND